MSANAGNTRASVTLPTLWDHIDVDRLLRYWQDRLNLKDWHLYLGDGSRLADGEEGSVIRNDRERCATVHIHPRANIMQAERILVHELLHIVHNPVDAAVGGFDSERDADRYAEAVEVFLNSVCTSLVQHLWTPIVDTAWPDE